MINIESKSLPSLIGGIRTKLQGSSLKAIALRGSAWTVIGHVSSQLMRLGSNVILAHLLFPAAFGLMALVSTVMFGIGMMSDIGLGQAVVHSKRGEDNEFLNTVWTLQLVRGALLWLITIILAYPFSLIYQQPEILWLLPLLGVTALIMGFQSVAVYTASRKIQLGRMTLMEFLSNLIGLSFMLLWAYFERTSVLPLVGGAIIIALVKVILSHYILNAHRHRITWDKTAVKELIHFGIWISLAAAMTFMGGRGVDMVRGALVPIETLGFLVMAGQFAWTIGDLAAKVGMSILFPALASIYRDTPERMKSVFIRTRRPILLVSLTGFLVLSYLGPWLVSVLYDERYQEMGTYLMLGSINGGLAIISMFYNHALLACGETRANFIISLTSVISRITFIVLGFYMGGVIGMLLGLGVGIMVNYPVIAWYASRGKILLLRSDFNFYTIFLIGAGLIFSNSFGYFNIIM